MSSQPSTIDSVKNKASSAYETVANSLSATKDGEYDASKDQNNVGKDAHGNKFRKGDLKDKLNEAACGRPAQEEESFTEKGINLLQQKTLSQGPETSDSHSQHNNDKTPPTRPEHDVQVEEFLRHQYHSRSGDKLPDPSSSN